MEFRTVSPEFITAAYQPEEAKQVVYDLCDIGEKLGEEAGILMNSKRVSLKECQAIIKASTIYIGIETAALILFCDNGIYSRKISDDTVINAAEIGLPITESQALCLVESACYRTLMCLMAVVIDKIEGKYEDNYTKRQIELILNNAKGSGEALDKIREKAKPELMKISKVLKDKRLADDSICLIYQACFVNRLTELLVQMLSVDKIFFISGYVTADVSTVNLQLTEPQAEHLIYGTVLQVIRFMCQLSGNSIDALEKLKKLNRSKGFGS